MDFLALSFVWGASKSIKAQKVNKTFSRNLPRTVKDAIDVTRVIGPRFIWIDAYCIPQDKSEIRSQQIGQMDKIYRSAVAVIVAGTGDSADYGLGGLTRSKEVMQPGTWLDVVFVTCRPMEQQLPSQPKLSTWSSRGWTLQEGVPAQRRITFTDDEIVLDCGMTCLRETTSGMIKESRGYLSDLQRPEVFARNNVRLWETLLSRFLQRNITYQEDVLDAIQGISNYLAEVIDNKCCWTLQWKQFLSGNSWCPADRFETPSRRTTFLRDGRRLPSWLWAAWSFRRINFDHLPEALAVLQWEETQWQEVEETGILEFEDVDVVDFERLSLQREERRGHAVDLQCPVWLGTGEEAVGLA